MYQRLGDAQLKDGETVVIGGLIDNAWRSSLLHQLGKTAQVDVRGWHFTPEDAGEGERVGPRPGHFSLVSLLQSEG